MLMKYVLDGRKVVECADLSKWAEWMETGDRRIARTQVGEADVSTVFLGVDYGLGLGGAPVVFETMIFGGTRDRDCRRYCTFEDAETGHAEIVRELERDLN